MLLHRLLAMQYRRNKTVKRQALVYLQTILLPYKRLIPLLLFVSLGTGCSHVDWKRVGNAAERAAKDPVTWGNASAAAAFAFNGNKLDRDISDWAKENTPLFGSQRKALEASDHLRNAADVGARLTGLLVPTEMSGGEWVWDKTKMMLFEAASASLTLNTTGILKETTERRRPYMTAASPKPWDSFPSAHASTSFNNAALGSFHAQQFTIPPLGKNLLSAGFYTLGAGTAWARVEGGVHYPSDVLFGAALGNFFAIFIYDGFVRNRDDAVDVPPPLQVTATEEGIMLNFGKRF
jgi:hypothetical protein